MMGSEMMTGGMLMGWGYLIFLIVGLALLLRHAPWNKPTSGNSGVRSSALEILRERYARGDIDREEFRSMKRDPG